MTSKLWMHGEKNQVLHSYQQSLKLSHMFTTNVRYVLRGCSAKRRRLMCEAELAISDNAKASDQHDWPTANSCPPLATQQASSAPPQPCSAPQSLTLAAPDSALARPETDSSCMEIEAAQRRLQEIEDRYAICEV